MATTIYLKEFNANHQTNCKSSTENPEKSNGGKYVKEYCLTFFPEEESERLGRNNRSRISWNIVSSLKDGNVHNNHEHISENKRNLSQKLIFETSRNIEKAVDSLKYFLTIFPQRVISDLFLPIGYPNSVKPGYIEYQFFDSIQGLSSYLRGVVTTSAVLTAAGVGDGDAAALSAAVNWALRDGMGMIGGLLFSYFASNYFDSHVKEFRLFADIINDIGLTLDLLSPHIRGNRRLLMSSFATLCKIMCGISAGATKSSITQHFSLQGNMADLNAKEGTQETLVSLIGILLGILLARYLHSLEEYSIEQREIEHDQLPSNVSRSDLFSWIIFFVLTMVHIWANFKGVKLLRLSTLNRERTGVVLESFIQDSKHFVSNNIKSSGTSIGTDQVSAFQGKISQRHIPNPASVNESLLESCKKLFFPRTILGARLMHTFQAMSIQTCQYLIEKEFENENYIVAINQSGLFRRLFITNKTICVSLREGSSDVDELKAFFHSTLLERCLSNFSDNEALSFYQSLISITHVVTNAVFDENLLSKQKLKESGWQLDRIYLGFGPWRAHWESSNLKTK